MKERQTVSSLVECFSFSLASWIPWKLLRRLLHCLNPLSVLSSPASVHLALNTNSCVHSSDAIEIDLNFFLQAPSSSVSMKTKQSPSPSFIMIPVWSASVWIRKLSAIENNVTIATTGSVNLMDGTIRYEVVNLCLQTWFLIPSGQFLSSLKELISFLAPALFFYLLLLLSFL